MAQKVNPIAVRLKFNRFSDSSWFSDYYYSTLLFHDLNFRQYLHSIKQPNANKLGFRTAKCLIHHFPKRSFIHLFCLSDPRRNLKEGLKSVEGTIFQRSLRVSNPKVVAYSSNLNQDHTFQSSINSTLSLATTKVQIGRKPLANEGIFWFHSTILQKKKALINLHRGVKQTLTLHCSGLIKQFNVSLPLKNSIDSFRQLLWSVLYQSSHAKAINADLGYSFGSVGPQSALKERSLLNRSALGGSFRRQSSLVADQFNFYAMHYFFTLKTGSYFSCTGTDPVAEMQFFVQKLNAHTFISNTKLSDKFTKMQSTGRANYIECPVGLEKSFEPRVLTHSSGNHSYGKITKSLDFYLSNVHSIISKKTKTFISLRPIKVNSIFQCACLVAQEVACKLEQKKSFRLICRLIFQQLAVCHDIKGIRMTCSGRLNGAEIAKTECRKFGETSLHVFSDKIDYAEARASTPYGILGVKVWISYI